MNKLPLFCLSLAVALAERNPCRAATDPTDQAVSALIRALGEKNFFLRKSAAISLGSIGPRATKAIPALINSLQESGHFAFGNALVKIGPKAATVMCKVARDRKATGRAHVIYYLRYFSTSRVVATLVDGLSDEDRLVRRAAAVSLGVIGPKAKEAVADLVKATRDKDEDVRHAAISALGTILVYNKKS
jgi:HEAT repeat protein